MEKKIDFLALYQRLFQTLSHGKMQELMDVSYEVTGVPILAVDIATIFSELFRKIKQVTITGIFL